MPIFEIKCVGCGYVGEVLVMNNEGAMTCPTCNSDKTEKLISATSSLTGREGKQVPGPQDTACCGSRPGQASGCAGPGSCCSGH